MTAADLPPGPAAWAGRGTWHEVAGRRLFCADLPPAGPERHPPLLVLHGFPTSSYDFHLVADGLRDGRRVLLPDLLGFGLSDKPDVAYTMRGQADLVAGLVAQLGLDRLCLLTHDVGDTVGGELLARSLDGTWPVTVERRVLANGSIYVDWAQLTAGQEFLLSLPDERLGPDAPLDQDGVGAALQALFGPRAEVPAVELADAWALMARDGGHRLAARQIRYIEERRRDESRWTGAIERHPSPLAVVWGAADPVAVRRMADRVHAAVPGSSLAVLDGIGHFPMLEAPGPFLAAVQRGLA